MEGFEAPARVDEFRREPIEQFRMACGEAGGAEVIRRGDKPATEAVLPEPIDGDAGRERIGGTCDPLGQRPPPFDAGGSRGPASEQFGEAGRNDRPGCGGVAANEDVAGLHRGFGLTR